MRESLGQFLRSDTEPFGDTGAEALDDDIRFGDQGDGLLSFVIAREVEGDAALAAVDRVEVRAVAVHKRRAPRAGVVAGIRLLDLDDVRAELGEGHRRVRPGEQPGEVDDPDAVQRLERRRGRRVIEHAGHATDSEGAYLMDDRHTS